MQSSMSRRTLEEMATRRDRSGSLWLVQAFTGLLLVFILGTHMIAHHFIVEGGLRDYQQVLDYVANPFVFIIEVTFVIVATIQSFRVEDTTGRKVYDQNGTFAEHLLSLPADRLADLLPGADGKPKPSLVNMLRLRRPIVIVDEAHNARTDLSFATLGAVKPSCIVEFTATPARARHPSNVLHHVSAAELKAADMIKMPLRVITRHPSQADQLLGLSLIHI